MRLATFNILHGRSPSDDRVDLDRFRAAVRSLDADVLALQEVDRYQARSAYADLTALAAEALGAPEQQFAAALYGTPGETWTAANVDEQPDSAAYGIALISRFPVRSWRVIRLAPAPVKVPMSVSGNRLAIVTDEPRVAVAATIDAPQGPITVVNTHLTFIGRWNRRQLKRLRGSLESTPRPLVLMGDLNMGSVRAEQLSGLTSLVSEPTFPANAPREQLDHILASDGFQDRFVEGRVHALPLSDHRALSVVLR